MTFHILPEHLPWGIPGSEERNGTDAKETPTTSASLGSLQISPNRSLPAWCLHDCNVNSHSARAGKDSEAFSLGVRLGWHRQGMQGTKCKHSLSVLIISA